MAIVLLTLVTLAYAGYNLFVKVAGDHAPAEATTTVLATMVLQIGAIATSTAFLIFLSVQGGHVFKLSTPTYVYALIAGVCIGTAEIGYLYIFGGVGGIKPLPRQPGHSHSCDRHHRDHAHRLLARLQGASLDDAALRRSHDRGRHRRPLCRPQRSCRLSASARQISPVP